MLDPLPPRKRDHDPLTKTLSEEDLGLEELFVGIAAKTAVGFGRKFDKSTLK